MGIVQKRIYKWLKDKRCSISPINKDMQIKTKKEMFFIKKFDTYENANKHSHAFVGLVSHCNLFRQPFGQVYQNYTCIISVHPIGTPY